MLPVFAEQELLIVGRCIRNILFLLLKPQYDTKTYHYLLVLYRKVVAANSLQ